MATGDIKTFDYIYSGLTLQINAIDNGDGTTKFIVSCISGAADINALYWNDGVADGNNFDLGTKKDNSLNMNGTGEDWDGGVKVSSTGLGSEGTAKPSYLTTGETYVLNVSVNWATLDTLGVRATSTSTAGGSIKGVDGDAVVTECPHVHINDVTVAEEAGNAVFTVTIEKAYLYDVVISYTTANGTAGSSDYTTTSGTVTILAGHTSATTSISVPILDDTAPEPTENFYVNLTGATAVLPGDDLDVTECIADNQGIGTITDTDVVAPPPPPISSLGLSHGYWKEHDGTGPQGNDWNVATSTSFESIFGDHTAQGFGKWDIEPPYDTDGAPYKIGNANQAVVDDINFSTAFDLGGGGQNGLAREAVAAYLNAIDEGNVDNGGTEYNYAYSAAQVVAMVQDAFDDSAGLTMAEVTALLLASHD